MRWLLLLGAFTLFASGVALSFHDFTTAAGLTYGAAVFCLIFTFLANFKRFKGFGIEAETWEQQMEEAADIVNHLKMLALATAEPIVAMAPRMGRLGSHLDRRELYETMSKIEAALTKVGTPQDKLDVLMRNYHEINMYDQMHPIIISVEKLVNKHEPRAVSNGRKSPSEGYDRIQKIINSSDFEAQPRLLEMEIMKLPEVPEAEKLAILDEHKEIFEDIKYYARTKKFRRLAIWLEGKG